MEQDGPYARNPEKAQQLEALLNRVGELPIGTLLTFEQLLEITQLQRRNPLYQLVIRVNRELLPSQTMLVNVRDTGYRKATAHLQMSHADKRRARGTRQLRHAVDELAHTDTLQLTETEKVSLGHQLQLANMRLSSARRRTLQAKEYSQKAVKKNDEVLKDLAAAQEALEKVWKRVR